MPGSCLLPRSFNQDHSRKCLIVDLDETLVHSSFKVCGRQTFNEFHILFLIYKFSQSKMPISSYQVH
jgi:TFIIF-interacting CTD phosphatase-like protein